MVKGNFASSPDTTSVELDGNGARYIFGEMDCSGASVSSSGMLLAGCPYATLKMILPLLFLPAVWFESLPLTLLTGI
jgi:hypothetical protein